MGFGDEPKQVGPNTFTWEKKDRSLRDKSHAVSTNGSLTAKLKNTVLGLAVVGALY